MRHLLVFFSLNLIALSATSNEYQAPKIKIKKHQNTGHLQMKEGEIDKDLNYRVREIPGRDRNLASEELEDDLDTRGPSSGLIDINDQSRPTKVRPWHFKKSN